MVLFLLPYTLRTALASFTFFVCNLFAAYQSFKSLHHRKLTSSAHWLYYWTLVGCFIFLIHHNPFLHDILHTIVPMYPEMRIVIHLFTLYHPTKCLVYFAYWCNRFANVTYLKFWTVKLIIVLLNGWKDLIQIGFLDEIDLQLLETLNNLVHDLSMDVTLARNKRKRASTNYKNNGGGGGESLLNDDQEVEQVEGRRSLHSSVHL